VGLPGGDDAQRHAAEGYPPRLTRSRGGWHIPLANV
jgi:hypothetical protein